MQFLASADYLREQGIPRRPADLQGHAIITDTNFPRPDEWIFGGDAPQTLRLRGRLRFSNAEACVIACAAGLGVTRVPDFVAAPAMRDGRLTRILRQFQPGTAGIYAITPAGRHMPSRLRVLISFLQDRWGGDHGWVD